MLLVPITSFATAALGLLLFRLVTTRDMRSPANRLFASLVALYLVQSLLVSVRWGYGVEALRLPVGMIAAIIPACAWLAFRALAGERKRSELWCLVSVVPNWAALIWLPVGADLLIPLTYLVFGFLIAVPVISEREAPALSPIGDARQTRSAMGLIGATLVASAVTDAFILYDFVENSGRAAGHVVSFMQTAYILIVGIAAGFGRSTPEEDAEPFRVVDAAASADHAKVLLRIEELFDEEGLHRSEELSLRRLSRRLGLPDRRVSEAVNRLRGVNVSQFVNEYRIREACALLRETDQSVVQIALAVGFASKSNFNREFQRVVGQTPTHWRRGASETMPKNGASNLETSGKAGAAGLCSIQDDGLS